MPKREENIIDELEFKPIPVKDSLKQMKEIFSYMLDMGFYSYLQNNEEIAKMVLELEREINKLSYFLIMNAILSARDAEESEAMAVIIKVGEALTYAANAAADIALLPLNGITPHPLAKEAFKRSEEIIESFVIERGSRLDGLRVRDLERQGIYVDVLLVKRDKKLFLSIRDDLSKLKLRTGDQVIVRGNDVAIEKFREANSRNE